MASAAGERSRRRLGREISDLGNLENEADGIEWGYRYDTSPVICHESGPAPIDTVDAYTPSSWPGARPPSLFLADGRALFDMFGRGLTLLRFADIDVGPFLGAAAERCCAASANGGATDGASSCIGGCGGSR